MNQTMPKQSRQTSLVVAALLALALLALALYALLGRAAQPAQGAAAALPAIALKPVVEGLKFPGHVTHAGDGTGRLFITELGGTVRVWDGALRESPLLDLRGKVATDWEQGLLSVAFHPEFRENGRFYVHYVSAQSEGSVISEFRVSKDDPNRAEERERVLLEIPNERKAHYGGGMQFGPDGYLYIAVGDGLIFGGARRQAQDLSVLPGKILRLDVDGGEPYGVPADNPFVGREGARPEIWAYGLRNPWRFSFDRETGRLFVGDVGHERFEEVNLVERGRNYGWPLMEGERCLIEGWRAAVGCKLAALRHRFAAPIATYEHLGLNEAGGNSVTGGFVYHGQSVPGLRGHYLYADYVSGRIWALTEDRRGWSQTELLKTYNLISSFGEDEQGELYVLDWSAGGMYQIVSE